MLKKEITYVDSNGREKTEEYYFNLTKAEIIEYDASFREGVMEYLNRLVKMEDQGKLIQAFKDLILRSYGEKTSDGRFIKSQELRDIFMASEAYSELFMEVLANEENMAAFVNGIIPQVPNVKETEKGNVTVLPATDAQIVG